MEDAARVAPFYTTALADSAGATESACRLGTVHVGDRALREPVLPRALVEAWGKEPASFVMGVLADLDVGGACIQGMDGETSADMSRAPFDVFLTLRSIQHHVDIDRALAGANGATKQDGYIVCSSETLGGKQTRLRLRFGSFLGRLLWAGDFILNRLIPRLPFLTQPYFRLTGGRHYSISKAEALGRLVRAGFVVHDFREIGGRLYAVARKHQEPVLTGSPSYHPVVRLRRVGKGRNMIGVFKLRTMHPYSEYLQGLIIELNGYNESGKPAEDFRIAPWGRFLRRTWLDEIPQLLNVLLGQMKLVGVRPLSMVRFHEFPPDMQVERTLRKPGCIPPYVALNMPGAVDNIEAERVYLSDLTRRPFTTDFVYMVRALVNILGRRIHSA